MTQILKLSGVTKRFGSSSNPVLAVNDVSFQVERGTTFGLVGESGSGKSTVARCALGLIKMTSGSSLVDGIEVTTLKRREMKSFRARVGMVFQNPVAALNPRMTVHASIEEPLRTHYRLSSKDRERRVLTLLDEVGLSRTHANRYAHQLSGGQCQRVGIARALAVEPTLLVLDEPTSALDVSVQAQVLNLLQQLKDERGLSYLLISHDLDVVRYMSDVVGVMYRGRIVETGPADQTLVAPVEEYTKRLIASMPETPGAVVR